MCNRFDMYQYKYGIPLIQLVHWWFIDREELIFNEMEEFHIKRMIDICLPMCDVIRLNICFDTYKNEYREFLEKYFSQYDNIVLTFDINDKTLCEYRTFIHIFDYVNCYIMYTHFKGIGCMKNSNKLSSFCGKSLDDEKTEVYWLYEDMGNFKSEYITNKIFFGKKMSYTYSDNTDYPYRIDYIDNYSSRYFYAGNFYIVNLDMLKCEMKSHNISLDMIPDIKVRSELLPSLFPFELIHHGELV